MLGNENFKREYKNQLEVPYYKQAKARSSLEHDNEDDDGNCNNLMSKNEKENFELIKRKLSIMKTLLKLQEKICADTT
jgi:hypothetical protein